MTMKKMIITLKLLMTTKLIDALFIDKWIPSNPFSPVSTRSSKKVLIL